MVSWSLSPSERYGRADIPDALLRVVLTLRVPRLRVHHPEGVPHQEIESVQVHPPVARGQGVRPTIRQAVSDLERLQTDVVRSAQEIGVWVRDPVLVQPVEGPRIGAARIVRSPAIRRELLGVVADVAGFRPEVLNRSDSALEERGDVEASHLRAEPEAGGEGGVAVRIDPDAVIRGDLTVVVDVREDDVSRAGAGPMGVGV